MKTNQSVVGVNINLDISTKDSPEQVTALLEAIRMGSNGKVNIRTLKSAHAPRASVKGPLEKKWCGMRNLTRVLPREGRNREEQAAHNLIKYAGMTQDQVNQITAV